MLHLNAAGHFYSAQVMCKKIYAASWFHREMPIRELFFPLCPYTPDVCMKKIKKREWIRAFWMICVTPGRGLHNCESITWLLYNRQTSAGAALLFHWCQETAMGPECTEGTEIYQFNTYCSVNLSSCMGRLFNVPVSTQKCLAATNLIILWLIVHEKNIYIINDNKQQFKNTFFNLKKISKWCCPPDRLYY